MTQASTGDAEQGLVTTPPLYRRWRVLACFTPIFLQAFTLTFLAEWGDRSQITTIILAAREVNNYTNLEILTVHTFFRTLLV